MTRRRLDLCPVSFDLDAMYEDWRWSKSATLLDYSEPMALSWVSGEADELPDILAIVIADIFQGFVIPRVAQRQSDSL